MIGILITARLGSSRLPKKHLIEANGKPLIYWLIKRFEQEFCEEIEEQKVILCIATSEHRENKEFYTATQNTSCKVFSGSNDNIPLRHLQCGIAYNLSHIISVDGDDILCSTAAARQVYKQMTGSTGFDHFLVTGLPLGMNLSGYAVPFLEHCLSSHKNKKLETGWGRIFTGARLCEIPLGSYNLMDNLRFTLDYEEDARFFCEVINRLKEKIILINDQDLVAFVTQNKLTELNAHVKEKYWENYNTEKQKEIDG